MVKLAKTLREYAKNLVEICAKSAKIVENRAKVAKSSKNHRQISKDTSTTLQNVIRNGKIRKNRKDTSTTLQKACIFRKIMYQSPGKLLEIVNFDEKSRNWHAKNPKSPSTTHQNLSKMRGQLSQNRRKSSKRCKIVEKSNPNSIARTRQNRIQTWVRSVQIWLH